MPLILSNSQGNNFLDSWGITNMFFLTQIATPKTIYIRGNMCTSVYVWEEVRERVGMSVGGGEHDPRWLAERVIRAGREDWPPLPGWTYDKCTNSFSPNLLVTAGSGRLGIIISITQNVLWPRVLLLFSFYTLEAATLHPLVEVAIRSHPLRLQVVLLWCQVHLGVKMMPTVREERKAKRSLVQSCQWVFLNTYHSCVCEVITAWVFLICTYLYMKIILCASIMYVK